MPRSQRPRKARQSFIQKLRPTDGSQLLRNQRWKIRNVFGPLDSILKELAEAGTINVDQRGTPIIFDAEGQPCEVVPALNGIICAYEIHEGRSGRAMPLEPLRILANKLHASMPVMPEDVRAAQAAVSALRNETMDMRADYAASLIRSTQVRIEMDRLQA